MTKTRVAGKGGGSELKKLEEEATNMEENHRGGGDEKEEDGGEVSPMGEIAPIAGEIAGESRDPDHPEGVEEGGVSLRTEEKVDDSDNGGVGASLPLQLGNHEGGLEENGDDLATAPLEVDVNPTSVKMEVDCDENDNQSKDSSSGSVTPANGKEVVRQEVELDTYLSLLERDQQQLNTLMVLKEREWDAILKLKKLKEIKIARLKRRRDVEEMSAVERVHNRRRSSIKVVRNNLPNADGCGGVGNKREVEARNNIRTLEKEVNELAKEVFSEQQRERSLDFEGHSALDSSQAEGAFLASNALKSLVNKNYNRPSSSVACGKVVGEGRQGPKVDVTTIIADYRLKTDFDKEAQRRSASTPTLPPMNQSTGISFTDLLTKMKTHYEKEKDLTTSPPSATVNNIKPVQASKVKAATSGGASNSASTNKGPAGTTLAKLLSSNNGNSVSRSLEESAMYNHKAASNNSAGSEKNLSLANLLASSKSRDEPLKKKSAAEAANVPVCQGCHSNKAQFVCAGCANQWYCSRECQVAAWDEHSDICSG